MSMINKHSGSTLGEEKKPSALIRPAIRRKKSFIVTNKIENKQKN